MPRYDYRCQAGHQYELQEPFGSPTEHECQKCGKPARRIVTVAPPLIFKAGGYYKTAGRDFKADANGASSSLSSDSKRSSESKRESSSTKSEAKPGSKDSSASSKAPTRAKKGSSGNGTGKAASAAD